MFRNRTVLGIICIAASLVLCFVVTPLINKGTSGKAVIVRMKADAKAGTMLTDGMLEEVEVGGYHLPEDVCRTREEVKGKYLTADVLTGDYLLAGKVSDEPAKENEYLYGLNGKKQAMSVTINTFAEGVSGKLKSGDIVSVIVPDYKKSGETVIPTELKYVEVIAVTAKSGYDANTEERVRAEEKKDGDGEAKELPSTVTVLVTPEQGKILAMLEAEQEMHLSLVYRGDEKNAGKFIDAQDAVLEEIKVALEEAEKQDVWEGLEGRVIGESGTTILSGTKKGSRAVITGNRIIGMPLPADASLGADEARTTGELIGGK